MLLNRILNNQLHLHDEGNPAWGMSEPYGRETKEEQTKKLMNSLMGNTFPKTPKNFAEELRELSNNYVSPKLDKIKNTLSITAALGDRKKNFSKSELDDYSIKWLKEQGLKVEDKWTGTREEGQSYYEISW